MTHTSSSAPPREPVAVTFGDHVQSAATVAPAEWIAGARHGVRGTVGDLVPNHYPAFLRVHAPNPSPEGWWSSYRDLFEIVASIGAQHTSSPDRAWFAVWEGHSFANATTHIAWRRPPDDATRDALDQERSRLRDEVDRRNAAIRAGLRQVSNFDLPDRTYYLLTGPVSATTLIHDPGSLVDWRLPDLFWPDDRRWFIATDVDFWSLYIGGSHDFITELAGTVPTPTQIVTLDHQLETED
jgi:hypothetical protein